MARKSMIIEMSLIVFLVLAVLWPSRLVYAKSGGGHAKGHGGGNNGAHKGHEGEHKGNEVGHKSRKDEHDKRREYEHNKNHEGHRLWHHHTAHYYHHGRTFHELPEGHSLFRYGGVDYYYYDGTYYTKRDRDYVVVSPPLGAVVPAMPQECEPLIIEDKTYYSCNDVTYLATPQGYQVVEAPELKAEN